jgi:hypothetical protein
LPLSFSIIINVSGPNIPVAWESSRGKDGQSASTKDVKINLLDKIVNTCFFYFLFTLLTAKHGKTGKKVLLFFLQKLLFFTPINGPPFEVIFCFSKNF